MHENPVTEAKIIAGPPGTTLRNRETTVKKSADTGTWKTWYGTRRAVRKWVTAALRHLTNRVTQSPHPPGDWGKHARDFSPKTVVRFHMAGRLLPSWGCGDRGVHFGQAMTQQLGAGVTYVHKVAANQRDWRSSEHIIALISGQIIPLICSPFKSYTTTNTIRANYSFM